MTARLTSIRRAFAAHPQRVDAVLAGVLCALALVQVIVSPIAALGVGLAIALASTLPIAFCATHPVAAAIVATAPWLIPTGRQYLYVGYIAGFFVLYAVGAHVRDGRVVAAVAAWGIAVVVESAAVNDEMFGAFVGALTAVIAPIAVGRFVRRQRAQSKRLAVAE